MKANVSRLAYDSGWKSPCILEHLLDNAQKTAQLLKMMTQLGYKIKASANGKWFDVVAK